MREVIDGIEGGIYSRRRRWTYHDDGGLSWPTLPSSFYLKWDPKPSYNQRCCQPSGNYRPMQMQHIVTFSQNRNIVSNKLRTRKAHRGNKAHVACTFPLDLADPYKLVWGIWDEHDSDLQWARGAAALFMWAQNKVSWARLAALPRGSEARMYIPHVPNIPISPMCCS